MDDPVYPIQNNILGNYQFPNIRVNESLDGEFIRHPSSSIFGGMMPF